MPTIYQMPHFILLDKK